MELHGRQTPSTESMHAERRVAKRREDVTALNIMASVSSRFKVEMQVRKQIGVDELNGKKKAGLTRSGHLTGDFNVWNWTTG